MKLHSIICKTCMYNIDIAAVKDGSVTCPACGNTFSVAPLVDDKEVAESVKEGVKEGLSSVISSVLSTQAVSAPAAPVFVKEKFISLVTSHSYAEAEKYFSGFAASGIDDAEAWFYAAVNALTGKKAFVAPRRTIDDAVNYLNRATAIQPKGIYYYLLAYIKYDYFERKFLNTTPNYKQLLKTAAEKGVTTAEINNLYSVLGVQRPSCL